MSDIQIYKTIAKYEDFLDDKIPEKRFRLVYPNKEVFYLTDEERNFLLAQVNGGARYVQIGEHTFTNSFITLYPIREGRKKEWSEVKDESGKVVKFQEV